MPSKGALLRLMDQVASADSLPSVYRDALDCLQQTLDVRRASVLVFDASRTMRFVAWAGLSDEYRAAVDGHSPWSPDTTDAATITVADVAADPTLADYLPVFERESIRALAFIPLRFGPKLLGKFMLYYAEPHEFSADEITIAEAIAGHVAFALEHHRIASELQARLAAEQNARHAAQTEAALREENERRLHLALDAGRMGAWEWDVASGRVEWSPQLESIHGRDAGSFGRSLDSFLQDVHAADLEYVRQTIAAALDRPHEPYQLEYRIVTPDGTPHWLSASGRVLVDESGKPARMIGICSDITERKRAEEASMLLTEASRILATTLDPGKTLENLVDIVVPRLADSCIVQVVDADGGLVPVEVAHREPDKLDLLWTIVRRWPSRPDRPGSSAMVLQTGKPALLPRVEPDLRAAHARDAEHLAALEALGVCSAVTVPLQAHGRTLGTLSLLSVESLRVYGEADLGLAQEIASFAALAIDNARLYAEAKTAVRARDDMIAVVSHDLRNPLQSISSATALLRLQPAADLRAGSLRSITLASEQMTRLVDDLLDISRMDAGQLVVDEEDVDLAELMREAQALLQPQAEERSVHVRLAIADDLPPIACDRGRILQVLGNLLGNALKFAPVGGNVTLSAERDDDSVRVSVADDGIGIAQDQLTKVFDRFWRGDHRQPRGAGLGLAVAKGIVEAHGGSIGAHSRLGAGSTFYFTLPAPPRPAQACTPLEHEGDRAAGAGA